MRAAAPRQGLGKVADFLSLLSSLTDKIAATPRVEQMCRLKHAGLLAFFLWESLPSLLRNLRKVGPCGRPIGTYLVAVSLSIFSFDVSCRVSIWRA